MECPTPFPDNMIQEMAKILQVIIEIFPKQNEQKNKEIKLSTLVVVDRSISVGWLDGVGVSNRKQKMTYD